MCRPVAASAQARFRCQSSHPFSKYMSCFTTLHHKPHVCTLPPFLEVDDHPSQIVFLLTTGISMAISSPCQRRVHDRWELLQHIWLQHADGANFRIQCKLEGCSQTLKTFSTYRKPYLCLARWSLLSRYDHNILSTCPRAKQKLCSTYCYRFFPLTGRVGDHTSTTANEGSDSTISSFPQQEYYMTQAFGEAESLSSCPKCSSFMDFKNPRTASYLSQQWTASSQECIHFSRQSSTRCMAVSKNKFIKRPQAALWMTSIWRKLKWNQQIIS